VFQAKDVDAEVVRCSAFAMKDMDAAPTAEVVLGPARVPLIERSRCSGMTAAGFPDNRRLVKASTWNIVVRNGVVLGV
jgi:hypothetical protein